MHVNEYAFECIYKCTSLYVFQCVARGYRNILLEAGLTACGEVVIVNRKTLERAGLMGGIARYTLEELRKLNITELHPLG